MRSTRTPWLRSKQRPPPSVLTHALKPGPISGAYGRPEETVSQPLPSLRCLCRSCAAANAAQLFFPLDRGLTPAAKTNVAAARLSQCEIRSFAPPLSANCSYDTDTYGTPSHFPLYPALKRWAEIFRPFRGWFLGASFHDGKPIRGRDTASEGRPLQRTRLDQSLPRVCFKNRVVTGHGFRGC